MPHSQAACSRSDRKPHIGFPSIVAKENWTHNSLHVFYVPTTKRWTDQSNRRSPIQNIIKVKNLWNIHSNHNSWPIGLCLTAGWPPITYTTKWLETGQGGMEYCPFCDADARTELYDMCCSSIYVRPSDS